MTLIRRLLPFALFGSLASIFLWKTVFAGQVFVPAGLLRYLAPWTAEPRPPWNPLMYDSVGQFYPWRHFASETMRAGTIPLWNPYQFCGTPFVANSQSAVFYPGNVLYYLLPTAQAAGWSVLIHVTLAGSFTFHFLKRQGLRSSPAALGGLAYAFSTWQVAWLHLPSFLATSCWLPLLLCLTLRVRRGPSLASACQLALAVGATLLAGHLQIAFYVLLAAGLLALWPGARSQENAPSTSLRRPWLYGPIFWLVAVLAGSLLALPQVLPSLELSRRSHRVGAPTAEGYGRYTDLAVSATALATLAVPDLFGNPSDADRPYKGMSKGNEIFNYAEGAMYVGIPTLFLALIALLRARCGAPLVPYCGVLAILSMLLALGTDLDALLYYYVPGFSQSGSPGRVLVLWAFALSVLAAFGWNEILDGKISLRALAAVACLVAVGLGSGVAAAALATPDLFPWQTDAIRAGGLLVAALVVASIAARASSPAAACRICAIVLPLVLMADLFSVGIHFNPTSAPDEVYPKTALITELQARAGHDRIMPVNPRNFPFKGPDAILPPNGAMVFGLRDLQGYDSLFPGQYKAFMNELAAPVAPDASPIQVGNMVFAKNPMSPLLRAAGTKLIVSRDALPLEGGRYIEGLYVYEVPKAPGRANANGAAIQWLRDDSTRIEMAVDASAVTSLTLADEVYPGWRATVDGQSVRISRSDQVFRKVEVPSGRHVVAFRFEPASFRVGLYSTLFILAACCGVLTTTRLTRPRLTQGAV